jgi:hypothetical protein
VPILPVSFRQEGQVDEHAESGQSNSCVYINSFNSPFDMYVDLPMYNAPWYPLSKSSGVLSPLLTCTCTVPVKPIPSEIL